MNRRADTLTAEKLHIALLTKEAFGLEAAQRYMTFAGLDPRQLNDVLERAAERRRAATAFGNSHPDRRARPR
ncbi:hypothetical protein [Massilia sp. YMA4]|uniref:ANTAR domain-containing protein n=1 Tax=[Empedobacter] haloabium TaxID=592317 RepID=A0ABZ1UJ01_9BURK|nr:hypothetical protein [Massilia sp. YMA4]AXA94356.1 hypothetical protein DPH57_26410 [Massilia sp. YMA4]